MSVDAKPKRNAKVDEEEFDDFITNLGIGEDPDDDDDYEDDDEEEEEEEDPSDDDDEEDDDEEEEEEDDEPKPKKKKSDSSLKMIASLQKNINALQAQIQQLSQKPAEEEEEEEVSLDFLDEIEDLEATLKDKKKLTEILQKVYAKAKVDALKAMPSIVEKSVSRQAAMQAAKQQFYSENPELVGKETVVAVVAQQVQNENPTMNMSQIMKETAKRTRELLNLKKKAAAREEERGKQKPAFVKGKGNKKPNNKNKSSDFDEFLSFARPSR